MDVRFSPEQQALRDSAAQVVDRLGLRAVRDLEDSERAAKLDAAVDASGWRELRVADDDGKPLASAVEAAIVGEELARGLADTPFLGPTLAAELRRMAAAPAASSRETVLLLPDVSAPASAAGASSPNAAVAPDALGAASAVVVDAAGGGYSLATVALAEPGPGVDLTRPSSTPAPSAAVMLLEGASALSASQLTRWTALGLALTCADLVGTMRGAVRLACDYASARRQYGVPVGSFQALQHLLADAQVATEGSRSVALHAAWAVDALGPDEALFAGAVAKAYCARAARTVCETAIQVHGGIGNTWDCLAHVYLRRALVSSEILGGVGPNLTRVLEHKGIGGSGHGVR